MINVTSRSMAAYDEVVQHQVLAPAVHTRIAPIGTLSSGLVRMPAGHVALPHLHARSEVTVFISSGYGASIVGERLEHVFPHAPGSVIYIGPGVPHYAVNLSQEHELFGFEARTDPGFNDDVETLPNLAEIAAVRTAEVLDAYRAGEFDDQLATPTTVTVTTTP